MIHFYVKVTNNNTTSITMCGNYFISVTKVGSSFFIRMWQCKIAVAKWLNSYHTAVCSLQLCKLMMLTYCICSPLQLPVCVNADVTFFSYEVSKFNVLFV